MADALTESVSELIDDAAANAVGSDSRTQLLEAGNRLREPLRVAIAGKVKAGKSTLLNALLGEELAPTDAGECTKVVTWYREGAQREVVVVPRGGEPESARFTRVGALEVELAGRPAADVERFEVSWPTPRLRELTIIDTPGIASISAEVSDRTLRVLTPNDDRPPVVDAVVYLLRHTHPSDMRFLESFHDDDLAHGTPMNTVGVLSRADEIGSCRLDAMEVAERVADRYQHERRLRRLCPVVVPVAGLLGYAGVTLRPTEYRALARLAQGDPAECAELLLTADRFDQRPSTIGVTELERQHLQARFGLFGVRLCVESIRNGSTRSAGALSAELQRVSGFDRLQGVLQQQFTERSAVLKARSALSTVGSILRRGGCAQPDRLKSKAEQITSGAHAFEEVRLLDALRTGNIELPEDQSAELDLLLGGSGHDPATRLGLAAGQAPGEIQAAALDALGRWRSIGDHPLSRRAVRNVAGGAQRTLEGILAETYPTDP